ncbi:MAG: shikimate kinase [Firmicutes bacterium]|jgi:shikimate kinase|nr:shikimate kinase [Bacillota bacterium]
MGKNLTLIGFMGTGKTSVGYLCAELLGWAFIDCDAQIEAAHQCTITEIFRAHGEAYFRQLETQHLAAVLESSEQVISTGGGIVTAEQSRSLLLKSKASGNKVLWLKAHPEVIYERVRSSQDRPLLKVADPRAEIARLLEQRQQWYELLADAVVDTSTLNLQQAAEAVLKIIGQW